MKNALLTVSMTCLLFIGGCAAGPDQEGPDQQVQANPFSNIDGYEVSNVKGIGREPGVHRRDNSNVIKVDGYYYVYYTKGPVWNDFGTEWHGSVWGARSKDGKNWEEVGEMVPRGDDGEWDHWAAYTPNILVDDGKYYLYYTGQPENQAADGPIHIGVAVSDSPEGPFRKHKDNPIFSPTGNQGDFDGHRVDDASVIPRNGAYWMYYKGRALAEGGEADLSEVSRTKVGLAVSDTPVGPWDRYEKNPVIGAGHEIMVWPHKEGIGVLSRHYKPVDDWEQREKIQAIYWAPDGKHFKRYPHPDGMMLKNPGGYFPDAYRDDGFGNGGTWGLSFEKGKQENGAHTTWLVRWELDLTVNQK